jgi:hypothetical protein
VEYRVGEEGVFEWRQALAGVVRAVLVSRQVSRGVRGWVWRSRSTACIQVPVLSACFSAGDKHAALQRSRGACFCHCSSSVRWCQSVTVDGRIPPSFVLDFVIFEGNAGYVSPHILQTVKHPRVVREVRGSDSTTLHPRITRDRSVFRYHHGPRISHSAGRTADTTHHGGEGGCAQCWGAEAMGYTGRAGCVVVYSAVLLD